MLMLARRHTPFNTGLQNLREVGGEGAWGNFGVSPLFIHWEADIYHIMIGNLLRNRSISWLIINVIIIAVHSNEVWAITAPNTTKSGPL